MLNLDLDRSASKWKIGSGSSEDRPWWSIWRWGWARISSCQPPGFCPPPPGSGEHSPPSRSAPGSSCRTPAACTTECTTKWQAGSGYASKWQAGSGSISYWCGSAKLVLCLSKCPRPKPDKFIEDKNFWQKSYLLIFKLYEGASTMLRKKPPAPRKNFYQKTKYLLFLKELWRTITCYHTGLIQRQSTMISPACEQRASRYRRYCIRHPVPGMISKFLVSSFKSCSTRFRMQKLQ